MNFMSEIKKEAKQELVPLTDLPVGSIFTSNYLVYREFVPFRNSLTGKYEHCPRKIRKILSREDYLYGSHSELVKVIRVKDTTSEGAKYQITMQSSSGLVRAKRLDSVETISIPKGVVDQVRHWT